MEATATPSSSSIGRRSVGDRISQAIWRVIEHVPDYVSIVGLGIVIGMLSGLDYAIRGLGWCCRQTWRGLKAVGRGIRWVHVSVGEAKRTLIALVAIHTTGFVGLIRFAGALGENYSLLLAKPLLASVAASMFYIIIRYGHAKFDPVKQILERNVAFVLYALAYVALVIVGFLAF